METLDKIKGTLYRLQKERKEFLLADREWTTMEYNFLNVIDEKISEMTAQKKMRELLITEGFE